MGFFSRLFGTRSGHSSRPPRVDPARQASFTPPPKSGRDPGDDRTGEQTSNPAITDARAASSSSLLSFEIDWKAEVESSFTSVDGAQLLVTDVGGLGASGLQALMAQRRSKDTPLVVVSPGLDSSALEVARKSNVIPVRAVPLPGQPLSGLLEDLAIFSGACALTKDLGFESVSRSRSSEATESLSGALRPDISWSDVSESDLGSVAVFRLTERGCSFSCKRASRLPARIDHLMRHEAEGDADGLRARLRRLGRPGAEVPNVRPSHPQADRSAIRLSAGYASPYFVTEVEVFHAELERPRVLLSAVPIDDLEFVMQFLERCASDGSSLIAVAPRFGDRVLAAMVVNKLRGRVSCVAVELRDSPEAIDSTISKLATATGAEVVATAGGAFASEQSADILGTALKIVAARSYLDVWAVSPDDLSDRRLIKRRHVYPTAPGTSAPPGRVDESLPSRRMANGAETKSKRYHNSEWGFSLLYPSDWQIVWENRPEGSWVMAVGLAGEVTRSGLRPALIVNARRGDVLEGNNNVTVVHIGPAGSVTAPRTPAEYIESSKTELGNAFSGFRLISAEEARFLNLPAVILVYSYASAQQRTQEMCVTVFGLGVTFQLTFEIAPAEFDHLRPTFDAILDSFDIGGAVAATVDSGPVIQRAADAQDAIKLYNRGVYLYESGQFRGALAIFDQVFKGGELQAQSAYVRAMCQKELGLRVEIPTELGDPEDIGVVYVASNLACHLLAKGHRAALTKQGGTSEVTALIDGSQYVIRISSRFVGFSNWAWRHEGSKSIEVADPSVNPRPTKSDMFVITLLETASSIRVSPMPETGLQTTW